MIFLYIVLMIVTLLFYILYNGPISFYLFFFFLVLPVFTFAGLLIASKRTRITFKSDSRVYPKGHDSPFMLRLENRSPFIIPSAVVFVRYINSLTGKGTVIKIVTPIYANNVQLLRLSVTSDHYGSIGARIEKVKIYDMLRLSRMKLWKNNIQKEPVSVTFIPDYIPLENNVMNYSDLGLESSEYSKHRSGDDPSEIFDIHEYIEGDRISRIHWKLTAKSEKTYVKDFSLPISNSICLAANVFSSSGINDELERYDAVVEAFFAISSYLSDNSIPHSMVWFDQKDKKAHSVASDEVEEDTTVIRSFLSNAVSRDNHAVLYDYLLNAAENIRFGHFIYITNSFDDKAAELLTSSGISIRYTVLYAGKNGESMTNGAYDNIDIINIQSSRIEQSVSELLL